MKKVLIIIFCLFISGCSNYRELNNIAVVSAIGIDYKDNEYDVSIVIKDNTKDGENETTLYSYSGKSLDSTLQKISLIASKTLYFIDLDVLVISTNAAEKLDSIMDYLSRENNVGINFYILCDDNFKDSVRFMQDNKESYGDYVKGILQDDYNNVVRIKYTPFLQKYLSPYYDVIIPYAYFSDNNYLIDKALIFKEKSITELIDFSDIQIYNILKNNNMSYLFSASVDDKAFTFKAMKVKSKISYDDGFIIKLDVNGILDEMEDIDLNDKVVVNKIIKVTEEKIKDEAKAFLDKLVINDSDVLGFKKIYYNKKRCKLDNISDIKYKIEVNVSLNRKGLIFYSLGGEYEKDK